MSNKGIQEKRSEPREWLPPRERAPSILREDQPNFARSLGLTGLALLVIGAAALIVYASGRASRIGPGWGSFAAVLGVGFMLFHAAFDRDLQVRRLYGVFGFLCLAVAVVVSAIKTELGPPGTLFLPYGVIGMTLGLFFLLAFAHNETEEPWRTRTVLVLGAVGAASALTAFIGGSISQAFLLPYGVILALLGVGYLWAFIALQGVASPLGYRAGVGMALAGVLVFLLALGRSLPALFHSLGWIKTPPAPYLVPDGLILMGLGTLYAVLAAGVSTDNRLIVMTRRELAAFFYSPIAYFVLFGFAILAWFAYWMFLGQMLDAIQAGQPPTEPVFQFYIINWVPVFSMVFIVPVLTMRLLSDEKRTGSLEVLLTAPVDEVSVVLSKFLAALVFFLVVCTPWVFFLVALRVQTGEAYDYHPLFAFFVALTSTGAGFISMGLFFSSLTRNQIIAAIPTFGLMLIWTFLFFIKGMMPMDSPFRAIITHVSYVEFWISAVDGRLSPAFLVFHISAAVFWLYATVKVLEARRWS